jgi:hypothetical protein
MRCTRVARPQPPAAVLVRPRRAHRPAAPPPHLSDFVDIPEAPLQLERVARRRRRRRWRRGGGGRRCGLAHRRGALGPRRRQQADKRADARVAARGDARRELPHLDALDCRPERMARGVGCGGAGCLGGRGRGGRGRNGGRRGRPRPMLLVRVLVRAAGRRGGAERRGGGRGRAAG